MTKKINIAILDDHQIVIDGLKLLLENEPTQEDARWARDPASSPVSLRILLQMSDPQDL